MIDITNIKIEDMKILEYIVPQTIVLFKLDIYVYHIVSIFVNIIIVGII